MSKPDREDETTIKISNNDDGDYYRIKMDKDGRACVDIPLEDLPPDLREQLLHGFAVVGEGNEVVVPTKLDPDSITLDIGAVIKEGALMKQEKKRKQQVDEMTTSGGGRNDKG